MSEHLLAIDALNVVRRCYEANPEPDSDRKAQGALHVSTLVVRRAVREHEPTHVVIAMDPVGDNWRHALYPAYQAARMPMPEPLRHALRENPGWMSWVRNLGALGWEEPGFEADDLLGSLSAFWTRAKPQARMTILSTDKDTCSLVSDRVQVVDHFNHVVRDAAWVQAKFGVGVHQVLDYLALMGDAVDGIPGVARVGTKSAARLLGQYGTLEGVLAAAHEIPGALGKSVRENVEMARLSRRLTALRLDVPLPQALQRRIGCAAQNSSAPTAREGVP